MSTLKVNNLQDLGADAVVTNGVIDSAALPAGSILQVVSAIKTDTFSTTSNTYTDVTGLSVSITPTSSSSNILVFARLALGSGGDGYPTRGQVLRDSTAIGGGTPVGNRPSASFFYRLASSSGGENISPTAFMHLDSPATTSALTYKIQVATETGATAYVNRSMATDSDTINVPRMASSITLMEVAG